MSNIETTVKIDVQKLLKVIYILLDVMENDFLLVSDKGKQNINKAESLFQEATNQK